MKNLHFGLLALPLVFAGGCTQDGRGISPLRGMAASVLKGNAYDRAYVAVRRKDGAALQRASNDMLRSENTLANRASQTNTVQNLTAEANIFLTAALSQPEDQRGQLMILADGKYRAAIEKVKPEGGVKAIDPNTLNSLGYYLADQGKDLNDWNQALIFTKAAYQRWVIPKGSGAEVARLNRALLSQDSYAWSLFKLGRFQEARVQQEQVLATARSIAPEQISADIVFHMAEIYRLVGEMDKARMEYVAASQMSPDDNLKLQIIEGIKALEYKQV
ncbi:hypothetical protein EON80_01230 [bacterium]|nr:MAG: hypothetical protein EON80_01230 [bacterium]